MFGMGIQELLVIMVLALLFFGAGRLPEVGRSLGRSLGTFKEGLRESLEGGVGEDNKKD